MKTKCLFILFFLQFNFLSFAQTDSTAYQRLYTDLVKSYASFSKPPMTNFYDALSKAAEYTLNPFNPHFRKALADICQQYHIEEMTALDSLFRRSFADLAKNDLWISAKDIYESEKPLMDINTRFLCACLTKEVTANDRIEKLSASLQNCNVSLIKDTAFLNNVRSALGGKTQTEITKIQIYFGLAMYQDCKIMNDKFNETIFNYRVSEQYVSGLNYMKTEEARNVIRFYQNKKFDSLAMIFPDYKKYIPEFTKFISKLNQPGVSMDAFYRGSPQDPSIHYTTIGLLRKDDTLGEMSVNGSKYAINSSIVSIKFKLYNPPKTYKGEKIMEIREDVKPKQQ